VSYEEPMEVAVRFSARQALFESEIRKSLPDWPEQVIRARVGLFELLSISAKAR
jgi:hypothetical protein